MVLYTSEIKKQNAIIGLEWSDLFGCFLYACEETIGTMEYEEVDAFFKQNPDYKFFGTLE